MRFLKVNKHCFKAVLAGSYNHLDLREFAQLCYNLALPLVRKKIRLGKLNLGVLGLAEHDVVQDIFAEMFRRDENNNFPVLQKFFEKFLPDVDQLSEAEIIHELWRLVCATVKHEMTRLYMEVDPTLAKILRNMKRAVEKTGLFEEIDRFGEEHLIPVDMDPRFELPPMDEEYMHTEFSRVVNLRDNTLAMVCRLHSVITEQEKYQKAVSLVFAALMFKSVYALGSNVEEVEVNNVEEVLARGDILRAVERICDELRSELYERYVGKGKKTSDVFEKYMLALKNIPLDLSADASADHLPLFEHLRKQLPELTKEKYKREHQTALEYFVKLAKSRIKDEFRE